MKNRILCLFLFLSIKLSAQIDLEKISLEIRDLKSASQQQNYWDKLYAEDQQILVNIISAEKHDALSLEIMIKTTLFVEIHGIDSYPKNNPIAVLNLSHCSIGEAQLAYWPIILKCFEKGGLIQIFGGKFPTYELEAIALAFYNYSLANQEAIYPKLTSKLKNPKQYKVSERLYEIYQNRKYNIGVIQLIGKWKNQPFENSIEEGFFEFVLASDQSIYLSRNGRFEKLVLNSNLNSVKKYKIEKEPFGWQYIFKDNGDLSLVDETGRVLIQYSQYE